MSSTCRFGTVPAHELTHRVLLVTLLVSVGQTVAWLQSPTATTARPTSTRLYSAAQTSAPSVGTELQHHTSLVNCEDNRSPAVGAVQPVGRPRDPPKVTPHRAHYNFATFGSPSPPPRPPTLPIKGSINQTHGEDQHSLYEDDGAEEVLAEQLQTTLARFVEVEAWRMPHLRDLPDIINALERTCRAVARLVRRAQTDDLAGMHAGAEINVQGEEQKQLDVVSNTILVNGLCGSDRLCCAASEEDEFPTICAAVRADGAICHGEYAAVFDPLDGSANIGAGLPCGTIFGILKSPLGGVPGPRTVLQKGHNLVAAGYCMYGAQTIMVFTMGSGVHAFVLDERKGKFYLTARDLRIPRRGKLYSINEANSVGWDGRIQQYIEDLKAGRTSTGEKYHYCYNGALVPDFHKVLRSGGIFGYPADTKNANGKLRLLYEGNPMAMIVEQAGGAATTGHQRILSVDPCSTHQRIPAWFGSMDDIRELQTYLRRPL